MSEASLPAVPLLRVRELSHRFPDGFLALDGVSLDVRRGEFVVLAGPNGSGKTVLMRHLNGLIGPSSGEVALDGVAVGEDTPGSRRRVGLVFQDADNQIVGQSVIRDVAFGPENLRLPRDQVESRVREALEATGLVGFDQRRPHTLSGGEKRRLAVAGVVAMRPDLLVLDEPFTGLDWPGCAALLEILLHLNRGGTALVVITHDLEKVLAHAGRLVLMNRGRIVGDDTPEALIDGVEALGIRRPGGPVAGMSWRRERESGAARERGRE